ncbi:hypothetical protein DRO66_04595 [Candidatus Bathyarchaeota archaeon]|nr:MAG: hypothetical protein DRO66_04595 [Candidatus Bathyarchaeota archaeon]
MNEVDEKNYITVFSTINLIFMNRFIFLCNSIMNKREKIKSFLYEQGRIAIVGLGNEYRTDDGAGIALIRLLKDSGVDRINRVALFEANQNLIRYIPDIENFQPSGILVLDAADLGIELGQIKVLNENQIIEKRISTHENNLQLAMAYLKIVLPEHKILFIGIQFKSLEMSRKLMLTEKIRKVVEELARLITDTVLRRQVDV